MEKENTGKVLVFREQVKNLLFGRLLAVWGYECYPLLRLGLPAGSGFTTALWYCGFCISQKCRVGTSKFPNCW